MKLLNFFIISFLCTAPLCAVITSPLNEDQNQEKEKRSVEGSLERRVKDLEAEATRLRKEIEKKMDKKPSGLLCYIDKYTILK